MYPRIFVVIATAFQRTELLYKRSLRSVYLQKDIRRQNINVILIDDNTTSNGIYSCEFNNIKNTIAKLRNDLELAEDEFKTTILPNTHTKGNSGTGAWNTGIYYVHKVDSNSFVSILDDDDEYLQQHLYQCIEKVLLNSELKAVFQRLRWVNSDGTCFDLNLTKADLTPKNFFIGNPGVQGSNMFFKTEYLIKIDAFNERYPNTTDRDLMIRFLSSIDTLNEIEVIEDIGIIHYNHNFKKVNNDLDRKREGLDLFYTEYRKDFSEEDYNKSLERAFKFFNYQPHRFI